MIVPPIHFAPAASRRSEAGFSLIEVTLAIGLLAFCMIPLMGLIPTGLNAQHSAAESAFAADALTMLSTAVHSSQFDSRDASGAATFRLPRYFSDNANPALYPTKYTAGQTASTHTYALLEDGSIRQTGDTRTARQTLIVQTFPPATDDQLKSGTGSTVSPSAAVQVYAIVAWPALPLDGPTTTAAQLKNRQGFVETYITYVPTY